MRSLTCRLLLHSCVVAVLVAPTTYGQESDGHAGKATSPRYTSDGKRLQLPVGFERWVFVGANLGLSYRSDVAEETPRESFQVAKQNPGSFHNVYLAPDAYEEYVSSGEFVDGTVLVMDVYAAGQREPRNIVDSGFFPKGKRKAIEVAVKNGSRPDRRRDSQGDWAYYVFSRDKDGELAKTARAFNDHSCFDCHRKHAEDDNVWVQFYPAIRNRKSSASGVSQ